jgi:hypothetical protein
MADPKNETKEPKAPVVFYLLKNVTRGRTNRTARVAKAVGRVPFVQRFAGGSILVRRARPARISEAALKANLDEIKRAVAQHRVEVTTLNGRLVNLDTWEVAPASAVQPLPNPPLDSAMNDKNENIGYDVPPTPEGTGMNAAEPELLQTGPGQTAEAPVEEPKEEVTEPVADPMDSAEELPPAPPAEEPAPEETPKPQAEHHRHGKGKRR